MPRELESERVNIVERFLQPVDTLFGADACSTTRSGVRDSSCWGTSIIVQFSTDLPAERTWTRGCQPTYNRDRVGRRYRDAGEGGAGLPATRANFFEPRLWLRHLRQPTNEYLGNRAAEAHRHG